MATPKWELDRIGFFLTTLEGFIFLVVLVLDLQKHGNRHFAEIILHCAGHITLEASATTNDIYASIDSVTAKIAQQMRKFKTRHLATYRSARRAA
jgi:putative sigma-54 modulation protein